MKNLIKIGDFYQEKLDIIQNGSLEDFIQIAKQYNLTENNPSLLIQSIIDKIKARCDIEGLSYDTLTNK